MSGKTLAVDGIIVSYRDFGSRFLGRNFRCVSLCGFNFDSVLFMRLNLWRVSLFSFDFD